MKTLRRSAVALAAACVVLFAMAGPASAATYTATINSGTITVTKAGQTTQNITVGGGTCPAGTLTTDITSTTTGTVAVTAASSTSEFLWNGTTYVSTLTLRTTGSTAGTYDHSTGSLSGLVVPLQAKLYTKASDCTAGTLLCTWNTNVTLGSSDFTTHGTGSTATLSGTGTTLALGGACAAPFATYTGGAVSVSALSVTLS